MRWTLGSNFVLNGTVKPDFSQVEADATQIAADERFALFYPEKRPFFVEALDQFNVPNTLVYTRTIVRPDGAVKLTGKLGRADVARALGGRSGADQLQRRRGRSSTSCDCGRALANSRIAGLLYSDRVGDGRANRVFGGDTKIVFGGKYFAQFQARREHDEREWRDAERPDVGGGASTGPDAASAFTTTSSASIRISAPTTASCRASGYVQPSVSNRFTWYGKPGAAFERFNVFATVNGSGSTTTSSRRRVCSRITRR